MTYGFFIVTILLFMVLPETKRKINLIEFYIGQAIHPSLNACFKCLHFVALIYPVYLVLIYMIKAMTCVRSLCFANVGISLAAAIYLQLFCGIREAQFTERITTQLQLRWQF